MKISIASTSEKSAAIQILTLAFSSDPMARWSLPDPGKFLEVFPSVVYSFSGNAFELKSAYIAERYAGVAVWLPPGATPDEESLMSIFEKNTNDAIKADMPGLFGQMQEFRPTEPHWYLPLIGVDPAHQGSGVGTALLTESLKAIDKDGIIAYLESSNPKNVSLYERHGFEIIGKIQSGSSPVVRPMLRRAQ